MIEEEEEEQKNVWFWKFNNQILTFSGLTGDGGKGAGVGNAKGVAVFP